MGELRLIRNSELSVFRDCRQRWYWEFVLGLKPKNTANALRFGELIHLALERYYIPGTKRGPHPASTFSALYAEQLETSTKFGMRGVSGDVEDESAWTEAGDLGVAMMNNYIETYGSDDSIEILAPELPFQVLVRHPKTKKPMFYAVGKLDAVYRNRSTLRIGLMDHKTARTISTDHLALDDQAGMYWTFAPTYLRKHGYLKSDQKIDHILYNFLRKAVPDTRPQNEDGQYLNQDGSVSKRQPPPYFLRYPVWRDPADRKELRRRVILQAWEMEQVEKGKLPIYKNVTRNCALCPFYDPCELHETGNNENEMLDLAYQPWEPYSDHEIERKG